MQLPSLRMRGGPGGQLAEERISISRMRSWRSLRWEESSLNATSSSGGSVVMAYDASDLHDLIVGERGLLVAACRVVDPNCGIVVTGSIVKKQYSWVERCHCVKTRAKTVLKLQ